MHATHTNTNHLHFYVEQLNEKQGDRIRFFLSKADTAGHESDRQVCTGIPLVNNGNICVQKQHNILEKFRWCFQ